MNHVCMYMREGISEINLDDVPGVNKVLYTPGLGSHVRLHAIFYRVSRHGCHSTVQWHNVISKRSDEPHR